MRKNLFGALLSLSIGLFLISGCAKDPVKPDAGLSPDKSTTSAMKPIDTSVADKAAADRAALEKAAADRAAAEKAAEDKAAAAKAALKPIHFDYDSYILRQTDRDVLYSNAEYLLKRYKGKVTLEGHCDERGSDEYNLALGENRAKAAMNYLLTLGVPAEQLTIVSYGKEKPVNEGHTEEAWSENRRVEFTMSK